MGITKQAVITSFLSKSKDRFHEYNDTKSLAERCQMVSEMEGIDGLEVVFPYEAKDPTELNDLLEAYDLSLAAVNVNVKAEPEFRDGGLTSNDSAIREKAVTFIKRAKDFAEAVNANKVTCCPLGDGYEFGFQCDYAESWKRLVETFGEAGSYKKEIPLFVEYKPSETRGRCFVDTSAKALCLLNDIGIPEMGITLDFGHSMYGNENPAEVVSLLANSPYPYYIHINDNDAKWDWDYFVGTKHFLEYVEFLYYLKKYSYDDYMTSDTSPTRWDITGTFETNARMTNKIWAKLDAIDHETFTSLITGTNYLNTWRFIERELLGL